jgi:hypothetical protein
MLGNRAIYHDGWVAATLCRSDPGGHNYPWQGDHYVRERALPEPIATLCRVHQFLDGTKETIVGERFLQKAITWIERLSGMLN